MAHNLHLMVIKAESGEDACNIVETEISDFGNENNWRTIAGAVSQDNEVHIADESEKDWLENMETIDKINAKIRETISFGDDKKYYCPGRDLLNNLISGKKKLKNLKHQDWYNLKEYAHDMNNRVQHNYEKNTKRDISKDFDILNGDTYKAYHFDEFGVTQNEMIGDEDLKTWIVFIDMHS